MLKAEEYRKKLQSVLEEIRNNFDVAEIRGSDVGSFIFAEKGNRAIEIYQSENNVLVELWENEEQKSENEIGAYGEAARLVIDWANHYEK